MKIRRDTKTLTTGEELFLVELEANRLQPDTHFEPRDILTHVNIYRVGPCEFCVLVLMFFLIAAIIKHGDWYVKRISVF